MVGESPGYDRQVAFRSLGLEALGLASVDIQLPIPWCPYSYVLVLDALEGTGGCLAHCISKRGASLSRLMPNLLLGSGG